MSDETNLYALPLKEFTAARNELATRVSAAGDRGEGARIRKLKRPTVAAWAINQLARRETADLQRLFDLRSELEAAAAPQDLRRLSQERRRLLSHLTDRARAILEAGGHPSSAATIDKVSQTLMAGDTDEDRANILEGTLAKELSPSGFGAFGSPVVGTGDKESAKEPEVRVDPKVERLQEELERAEAEVDRLERIALEAEAAADAARAAVTSAERTAATARKRLEKATDR